MIRRRTFVLWSVIFVALLTSSCTTLEGPANPDDPLESMNRGIYAFNKQVDQYALEPLAKGYKKITNAHVDKAITNFYSNLDDIVVIINDILQLNATQGISDISRLFVNTTVGVLGFFDVATQLELVKHNEDFGQTLGAWGVHDGPYVVLPFIGPSSIRDGIGFVVDTAEFDVINTQTADRQRILLASVKYIDIRSDLLRATRLLDEIAPDPYAFTRDAWVQRRKSLVNNGESTLDTDVNDVIFEDDLFVDDIIRK